MTVLPRSPLRLFGFSVIFLPVCLTLTLALSGCATINRTMEVFGLADADRGPQTPEFMAMDGLEELNRGNYRKALTIFQELKERYPFSAVGPLAELKAADATFYLRRYQEAHALYQSFANNHPTNEAIPYVLFQMGMSHYNQIDTVDRNPAHAINAVAAFSRLTLAFPDSPYDLEARARILAARDFLARHEMFVATFFIKTKELPQAERRLDYLLTTYPESSIAPRATELLAAIQAGNPPTRTWRDWLPNLALDSWRGFFDAISPAPGGISGVDPTN